MAFPTALTVQQVMIPKPVTAAPDEPLREVVKRMNEHRIGAVLIVDAGRLTGIFTERDLLRHTVGAEEGWMNRPVRDWMTPDPWTLAPEATLDEAFSLMEISHIRHLPVVREGEVLGMVSTRDLINSRAEHLDRQVAERTRELQETNQRLQQRDAEQQLHMTVAARLQARLLPSEMPDWPHVDWSAHYEPLDPLGGDYYDFIRVTDRHYGVLIADASGHSIPAAMVAIMARFAFGTAARNTPRPGAVLSGMNRYLHGLTGEHFVTAFYGVFDRETNLFSYANAGHPYPYRYAHATKSCEPLAVRGLMLGVMPQADYDERHVRLHGGDRLLFYTDGVPDCRDVKGDTFAASRIESFLQEAGDQSAESITRRLADLLTAFRGVRSATDDMTILTAAVK